MEQVLALDVEDERLRVRRMSAEQRSPGGVSKSMYSANSAYVVFVATPLIPEIEMWPPCSPLMNVKSANTGWRGRVETEGERVFHLVDEERDVALGAAATSHPRARFRREPHLRDGAEHLDVDAPGRAPGIVRSRRDPRVSDATSAPSISPKPSTTIP